MARSDITQSNVLTSIVAILRNALSLSDRQCFETLEPLAPPVIPKGGDFFVTVAPGEGIFVDGEQAAGNCTEEWSVIVTGHSRIVVDSADHDEKLLQDTTRGLLVLKARILAALVGAEPTSGGNEFVRDLVFAQRAERPQAGFMKNSANVASLSIYFGVNFDWDLT